MDDCVFCNIIAGKIPSATVYEDEEVKVILDRFPGNEGHLLVMPKQHVENIYALDDALAAKLFQTVIKAAKAQKKALHLTDMNLVQNNGPLAGQSVPHFHIHLIPRTEGDNIHMTWAQMDLTDEQIEAMRTKIADALKD